MLLTYSYYLPLQYVLTWHSWSQSCDWGFRQRCRVPCWPWWPAPRTGTAPLSRPSRCGSSYLGTISAWIVLVREVWDSDGCYQSTFWLAMMRRVKHLFLFRVPWYFRASALSFAFSTLADTAWIQSQPTADHTNTAATDLRKQGHFGHQLSLLGASLLGVVGVWRRVPRRSPCLAGTSVPEQWTVSSQVTILISCTL